MNAVIIREARACIPSYRDDEPARCAILQIDGVHWSSPTPNNAGEAESYNEDARRIVEAVRERASVGWR